MKKFICKHHGKLKKSEIAIYICKKYGERQACKLCKKVWRDNNEVKIKKWWKRYYEKNKRKILARQAIYFQNNKEYYYAKKREYRAMKRRGR